MKILQIASGDFFSTYGGGQVYVKNIVDEMIRQQYDVIVFSFVDRNIEVEIKTYKGHKLYEIGERAYKEIKALLEEIHPDIVHAHSQKALMCTLCEELSIPIVVTAHHGGILCPAGTLMNSHDEICQTTVCHRNCLPCCLHNTRSGKYWYPILRLFTKKFYLKIGQFIQHLPFIYFVTPLGETALYIQSKIKEWQTIVDKCTKMIAPSYSIADAMIRNGLSKDKVIILPHGIPLPVQQASFTTLDEGIKFFYVGRICYVKGIHILLKAFHAIPNKDIELHLIGGVGNKSEGRYMRRLQNKYSFDRRIVWHGNVSPDEIYSQIKDYLVMVHPTICLEAFGLDIAESLAMGKPVLATRCGGAEMQIVNGQNGWLVEPNRVTSLKNKMEVIISHFPIKTTEHNTVSSIQQHCEKLLDVYSDLIRV
jgi:glycosyltransferase involved in cell wall biosynthesis